MVMCLLPPALALIDTSLASESTTIVSLPPPVLSVAAALIITVSLPPSVEVRLTLPPLISILFSPSPAFTETLGISSDTELITIVSLALPVVILALPETVTSSLFAPAPASMLASVA